MSRDEYESLFYKMLGEILVGMRQKQGRTFEDVACILDIPPMTFYKWENGTRKIPLQILYKLCKFYKVSIDEVIEEANRKIKK